jgi:hypothetical protein
MQIRTRTVLACSLWLAAFGCCAAGLLVTLAVTRPLTIGVLADGAAYALAFPLGYATIGWSWPCGGRPTRSAGCMRPPG